MRYTHRERIIQLSLIVFCCLFVAVSRTEVSVNSQSCIVPNLAPPPKFSWYKNQQVAVRIDDAWSPEERGYFQQGIEKWNQALNCSGVLFHDYSPIHFTNYSFSQAPPDFTVWWAKTSPLGVRYVFTFPESSKRLRTVIIPIALAEYDKTVNGGNNDRIITPQDSVFISLRLWQDVNHNGTSEPSELKTLSSVGLTSIELDYKAAQKFDEYGNNFRYRAKVKDVQGAQLGRWAWDVFLVSAP